MCIEIKAIKNQSNRYFYPPHLQFVNKRQDSRHKTSTVLDIHLIMMHVLRRVWRPVSVSHRIHLWGVFGVTSVEIDVKGPAWGTKGKFWGGVLLDCYPKFIVLNKGRQVRGPEPEHDFLLRMWQAL